VTKFVHAERAVVDKERPAKKQYSHAILFLVFNDVALSPLDAKVIYHISGLVLYLHRAHSFFLCMSKERLVLGISELRKATYISLPESLLTLILTPIHRDLNIADFRFDA